jgi:dephospho-CoA kinase
VAAYLGRLGFRLHSLSDIVREAAAREGLPPERRHLIDVGVRLRRESGPGVLALQILPRVGRRDVVDSIRHPAEVEVLRRLPGFVLVAVGAQVERRFARAVGRGRAGDPQTIEEFVAREAQENSASEIGQQLEATARLADRVLSNDGTLDELHRATSRLLSEIVPCRPTAGPLE